jgi:predicted P-loop ATPase
MPNVSLFPNIKVSQGGAEVEIHSIMSAIQNGKWMERIVAYREKKSSGASKEESEKIKSKFPYFTVSGTFSKRKVDGLIQHSGKIAIDFDFDSNEDLLSGSINEDGVKKIEQTKQELCNDKYSEYVFYSCSGNGICVIVNIDSEKHLESFLFLEKYYKKCYKLNIDKSCKDVTRARYISYDPGMFYNPNYESVTPDAPNPINNNVNEFSQTIDSDEEKYEWAKSSHDRRFEFVEGQRHHYLIVLAYWLNKCGVSHSYVMDKFLNTFTGNGKTEGEITRIVNDAYKNTLEHGTYTISKKAADLPEEFSDAIREIYHEAHCINEEGRPYNDLDLTAQCQKHLIRKEIVENIFKSVFATHKDSHGIAKKSDIYKIEFFISKRYQIAKNEITHRIEYKLKDSDKWENLNEHTVYRELQHAGIKFTLEKLKSLFKSDFVPLRNPIREYFDSLPEWVENEEPDYITELAKFIKTDNDPFWHTQFKKALVRNIACTLDYKENRIIMVLVEMNQETGKTSFIRFLCPAELAPYYTETAMDSSKDSDIQLSQNMFWNLEELAALHNNEINKMKATISKSIVKQRNPYGEHAESNPRRVNFWASTNKTEFLTDDQNTRWLCFNVVGVDHDYHNTITGIRKININNVWSQAYSLYKSGYNYQLTKEEKRERDNQNKSYELVSVEKDLILSNFINPNTSGSNQIKGNFMSYTEILLHLQNVTDNKIRLNINAVAKAMRQLGYTNAYKKIEGNSVKGFWCVAVARNPLNTSADNTANIQGEIFKPADIPAPENGEDIPF